MMEEVDGVMVEPEGSYKLSCWWGLSYAGFLTLPRVLLDAMPPEWQGKLADLLEEYDRTWEPIKEIGGTRVQFVDHDGKLVKAPRWLKNYRRPSLEKIEELRIKKGGE